MMFPCAAVVYCTLGTTLTMLREWKGIFFCYIHEGGEVVKSADRFNDMFSHVYVAPRSEVGEMLITQTSGLTPIVASNSAQVISSHVDPPTKINTHSPTIESFGFSQRCAESNVVQLELRNSPKHMTLVCTIAQCPWKVTARAIRILRSFKFTHSVMSTTIVWKMSPPPTFMSIQGFALGCRPIIAIDSSIWVGHMGEIVIISDRHPTLVCSVPEVFGLENHAYYYRHLKENFSRFVSKQNTKGNKGKENALQFLDSIAYARHERHHSICNFLMEHMAKLGSMLVKHKEQSNNWKWSLEPQLKKRYYRIFPRGWQMFGIPCEHATIVILSISHNVADFVDDYYKFPIAGLKLKTLNTSSLIYRWPLLGGKKRTSPTYMQPVIARLLDAKRDAIKEMGFKGTTRLGLSRIALPGNYRDVSNIMGIPSNGGEIVVLTRRDASNCSYTITLLEQNLEDLAIDSKLPESGSHSHAPAAGGPSWLVMILQRLVSSLAEDVAELRSRRFGLQYRCSSTQSSLHAKSKKNHLLMPVDIHHSAEEFVEQPILPSAQHSPAERHDSTVDHGPAITTPRVP
ncbi:hypothetical protein CK203_036766 [Vitis vinifera]|uniref:Uncharacterized protein n=1 Tax=Vitis vinifera TaxID=29760 RepID=A0A438I0N6_VITVI|nr:hypothetical protein CK203_036766 [Vitis vinifera]